jgi:hypothetical protein
MSAIRSVNGDDWAVISYHFVVFLADLLSEQLVLPLCRLSFVFGHNSRDDKRHGCNCVVEFVSVSGGESCQLV